MPTGDTAKATVGFEKSAEAAGPARGQAGIID
jgi:hypothetical protein